MNQSISRSGDGARGFTLLELLVVISIIGILVGIMLPAIGMVSRYAKRSACGSNLRQVGIALESYQQEFNRVYPDARYMPSPFLTAFEHVPSLPETLSQYINLNNRVYHCPGDGQVFPVAGMSYSYNTMLSGREPEQSWMVRRLNYSLSDVPVALDCDGGDFALDNGEYLLVGFFHIRRNLLFADGHVGEYADTPLEPTSSSDAS